MIERSQFATLDNQSARLVVKTFFRVAMLLKYLLSTAKPLVLIPLGRQRPSRWSPILLDVIHPLPNDRLEVAASCRSPRHRHQRATH